LADFQKNIEEFNKKEIKIIAGSIDSIEDAKKTIDNHKLTYPVAYGIDAVKFSKLTGAFYSKEKGYLQGTGFILNPEGNLAGAVYSTNPIGRYTASECLSMIGFMSGK
jgi:peroxiredoxin